MSSLTTFGDEDPITAAKATGWKITTSKDAPDANARGRPQPKRCNESSSLPQKTSQIEGRETAIPHSMRATPRWVTWQFEEIAINPAHHQLKPMLTSKGSLDAFFFWFFGGVRDLDCAFLGGRGVRAGVFLAVVRVFLEGLDFLAVCVFLEDRGFGACVFVEVAGFFFGLPTTAFATAAATGLARSTTAPILFAVLLALLLSFSASALRSAAVSSRPCEYPSLIRPKNPMSAQTVISLYCINAFLYYIS